MSPFPRQLAWFTAGLFSAAIAAALILFAREGSPQLVTLLVFGALIAVTAHLPVVLRKGVCVSPGLLVGMAAIVVFDSQRSLLGVALVGSLTQLRVSDFRKDRWGWVPFNAGLSFLAYLAAAAVLTLSHASSLTSTPVAVLVMVPAALAYIVVVWSLIVLSYLCEGTRSPREVLAELLPAGVDILPFAGLGFLVGRLYLSLGAGVLALIFVPILIAREMFRSYIECLPSARRDRAAADPRLGDERPLHRRSCRAGRQVRGLHRRGDQARTAAHGAIALRRADA